MFSIKVLVRVNSEEKRFVYLLLFIFGFLQRNFPTRHPLNKKRLNKDLSVFKVVVRDWALGAQLKHPISQ